MTTDARKHLADGQFPPGSMGPKVTAALDVAARGGRAVITSLDHAVAALEDPPEPRSSLDFTGSRATFSSTDPGLLSAGTGTGAHGAD